MLKYLLILLFCFASEAYAESNPITGHFLWISQTKEDTIMGIKDCYEDHSGPSYGMIASSPEIVKRTADFIQEYSIKTDMPSYIMFNGKIIWDNKKSLEIYQ